MRGVGWESSDRGREGERKVGFQLEGKEKGMWGSVVQTFCLVILTKNQFVKS